MCGIVGVASRFLQTEKSWLKSARDTMVHRGPDGAGEWWSENGQVGFGHRRLSIIDLTNAGHQPMLSVDRGLSITFNGEIYNYKELKFELSNLGYGFKSDSDTEVLLLAYDAWGKEFLSKLNGMFAFGIYDIKTNELILGRDRSGEKPLFYRFDGKTIYFASELKALISNSLLPKSINKIAIDCYLAMGYVPGNLCILDGYNKLPPGHAFRFNLSTGKNEIWSYWQLPDTQEISLKLRDEDLEKELEMLLEDSVKKQMIADVEVGVLLSGGVDSSLVTAMAIRHAPRIKTFSIGFSGHGKFDETPHASLIANYFRTEHTILMAEPPSPDLIINLSRHFDEPIIDSSMIPTWMVSKLIKQHCSVALGGDGGDELFGGYGHYSRLFSMKDGLKWIPNSIRKLVSNGAKYLPVGFKGRNWLLSAGINLELELPLVATYFDPSIRNKLIPGLGNINQNAEKIFNQRIPLNTDLLQRATRMDFCNYLPEDILVKVDRASMMNSLEIRAPFLDHRIIEFAFSKVPSSLKASKNGRKIILKKLCDRLLPPDFDKQRKQGFGIPINSWLNKGSFRDLFWDILSSNNCIFDRKTNNKLLVAQDRGYNNGERLFALVLFELWRKEYGITI